jgi:hypothetical protein
MEALLVALGQRPDLAELRGVQDLVTELGACAGAAFRLDVQLCSYGEDNVTQRVHCAASLRFEHA